MVLRGIEHFARVHHGGGDEPDAKQMVDHLCEAGSAIYLERIDYCRLAGIVLRHEDGLIAHLPRQDGCQQHAAHGA